MKAGVGFLQGVKEAYKAVLFVRVCTPNVLVQEAAILHEQSKHPFRYLLVKLGHVPIWLCRSQPEPAHHEHIRSAPFHHGPNVYS